MKRLGSMQRLTKLQPHEVSLVPKGANKKKFYLTKEDKGSKMPAKVNKGDQAPPKPEDKPAPAGAPAEAPQKSERAMAALKAMARIAAPHKDELKPEDIHGVMKEIGMSVGGSEGGEHKEDMMKMDLPQDVKEEHHMAAMKMAEGAYKTHLAKLGYRKYPDAEVAQKTDDKNPQEDKVPAEKSAIEKADLSAFDEKQKAALEPIFKAYQDQVAKSEKLEADLKTERDARVIREFTTEAEGLKNLGGSKAELALVLKSVHDASPETHKKLVSILKAADEQISKGSLFEELGSSQSAEVGQAEAKLDAAVNAIVQKSDGTRTREQIYDDFIQTPEGSKLYAQAMAARPGGI